MMYQGYGKIFWGLIFSSFHINYGPIHILPAFVGWLIIASGAKALEEEKENASFKKAHYGALIEALLTFFIYFGSLRELNYNVQNYLSIIFNIVLFLFVYYLLEGSIECLYTDGRIEIAAYYERVLTSYMTIFIVNTVILCIFYFTENQALKIITVVLGFFLNLWLMLIISRLRKIEE